MSRLYYEYDTMSKEYNFKHVRTHCPICKHSEILQDSFHQETYCTRCGTVLKDTTIFQVTQAIQEDNRKVKFIRDLWRRKYISSALKK